MERFTNSFISMCCILYRARTLTKHIHWILSFLNNHLFERSEMPKYTTNKIFSNIVCHFIKVSLFISTQYTKSRMQLSFVPWCRALFIYTYLYLLLQLIQANNKKFFICSPLHTMRCPRYPFQAKNRVYNKTHPPPSTPGSV